MTSMAKVYFCGTDLHNCLNFNNGNDEMGINSICKEPVHLTNVTNVVYNHFCAIYQKAKLTAWYITAVELKETEIFSSLHRIREVAVTSNEIVGLSEDGNAYRMTIKINDYEGKLSLKISELQLVEEVNGKLRKIASNDLHVYGLQSEAEVSKIYKITESVECIAEFPGKVVVDFCVGHGHFVALSETGAIWNWGHCGRSELACCDEVSQMSTCDIPRRVYFFDDFPCVISKIACGGWHTLALTSDGDIYSWGWNESGQLGHDSSVCNINKTDPYPVELGSAEDPVIDISCGSKHSVALLKSGDVYSWGRNLEGQAGVGHLTSFTQPQKMILTWRDNTAFKIKCEKWSSFIFAN